MNKYTKEILQLTGIFAADPHLKPDIIPEFAVSTPSRSTGEGGGDSKVVDTTRDSKSNS